MARSQCFLLIIPIVGNLYLLSFLRLQAGTQLVLASFNLEK